MADKEKKEENSLKYIVKKYRHLAGAYLFAEKDPKTALVSVRNGYNESGLENDQIIAHAVNDASIGVQAGRGISNSGVLKAMEMGYNMIREAYENSTAKEFVDCVASYGFSEIPKKLKDMIEKYKGKMKDALEAAKEKKDEVAQTIAVAMEILFHQFFYGQLYPEVITSRTKENLEALVKKEDAKLKVLEGGKEELDGAA